MRRRAALGLLGGAMLAGTPGLRARAQPTPARVGWLQIQDARAMPGWRKAFRAGLIALGRTEGRDWTLEPAFADGDAARLDALARALVEARVAVIVATSQPALDAARRATSRVPIVARMTDDPVEAGAARSLAQPGGNVTGVHSLLEELSAKRLEMLRQASPSIRRVGALLTLDRGATRRWLADTEAAARPLDLAVVALDVRGPDELEAAFARAAAERLDALLGFRNPTIVTHVRRVVELATRHRLPSIFDARDYAELGALLSYGPSLDALFGRLASYVDRILRGAAPADLAIEQPTALELVVNRRTAQAFGLTLPPTLLAAADEVIE